jgi:hypothetical protein
MVCRIYHKRLLHVITHRRQRTKRTAHFDAAINVKQAWDVLNQERGRSKLSNQVDKTEEQAAVGPMVVTNTLKVQSRLIEPLICGDRKRLAWRPANENSFEFSCST